MVLNKTYGFTGEHALQAPQANAPMALIEPLMTGAGAKWALYGMSSYSHTPHGAKSASPPLCTWYVHSLRLNLPLLVEWLYQLVRG